MQSRPLEDLDPLARLSACRQWGAAEALARDDLTALRDDPKAHPLALARATRRLADVLLESQRADEATDLVVEARRRYRPFLNEPGPLAEIQLTIANHAFMTQRSLDAEAALDLARKATENDPQHRLFFAKALRLQAHLAILSGELRSGAELLLQAWQQTSSDDSASLLLRLQYLFSLAEVYYLLDEHARVRELVQQALDLLNAKFTSESDLFKHGRARAIQIYTANGDAELAAELDSPDRGDP